MLIRMLEGRLAGQVFDVSESEAPLLESGQAELIEAVESVESGQSPESADVAGSDAPESDENESPATSDARTE